MVSALLGFLTASIAFVYHSVFFERPEALLYQCPVKSTDIDSVVNATLSPLSQEHSHSTPVFIGNSFETSLRSTPPNSDESEIIVLIIASLLILWMLIPLQYLLYCSSSYAATVLFFTSLSTALLVWSLRFNLNNLYVMRIVKTLQLVSVLSIVSQVIGCLHYFHLIRNVLGLSLAFFGILTIIEVRKACRNRILA